MKLTVEEIIHATKGKLLTGKREQWVTGVSTDSRNITAGELFVPLKGNRFDGHDYIENAIRTGAAASLLKQSEAAVVSVAEENGCAL
ncbi:MAG TPA: UDP-N-acetylmuramoyl-tripeptide--D-alanyl-D-alanine ligase, partial [Clostridiales bacterium]|nr:UDP-N-acetylmuramoyl-tripeptide--D-alanyl-D-alanine ligase [Clostridiales bacterium]